MNRTLGWMTVLALSAAMAGVALAGAEALDQAAAEALIKGNTAEGTNQWNKNMTWHFDESGQVRKKDHLGNKGKAKWHIDRRGQLCFQDKHMKTPECGAIVPRAGGGYGIKAEGGWKWDKVVPGNPHNL